MITMQELAEEFRLPVDTRKRAADMVCPICGHKTLHIDFAKEVFACPACAQVGGGVIDAWALFRNIESLDVSQRRELAKQDMREYFKEHKRDKHEKPAIIYAKEKSFLASIEIRDKAYRRLLEISTLSEKDKKNLLNRGLTEEEIENLGYKTVPKLRQIDVKKLFEGYNLAGVPGFYKGRDGWGFVGGTGFLIPERDLFGRIQAFQIRTPKSSPKYLMLSSSNELDGVSCPAITHIANMASRFGDTVILTEGPLKADIINKCLQVPVLAIPGVNSQKHLETTLKFLKKRGLKKIEIAFDMDYKTNPHVQRALSSLKRRISDLEIEYVQLKWDENYKGYDDYLMSKEGL